jgi:hypothetical protein
VKRRRVTVKIASGDVRMLRVVQGKRSFRLAVHDEDSEVPLIQAKLSVAERQSLQKALGPDK